MNWPATSAGTRITATGVPPAPPTCVRRGSRCRIQTCKMAACAPSSARTSGGCWKTAPPSATRISTACKPAFANQEISGDWIDEPCIMQAGQVSFHHALTLHGSGPNLTWEPRMCIISHMMPGGTTYRPDAQWHPNSGLPGPQRAGGPTLCRPLLAADVAANRLSYSAISPVARSRVSCTRSSCANGRVAGCAP